jgi:hypothetical protein
MRRDNAQGLSFVLPSTFHPGEFLKAPSLIRLHDDARYFIHLVLIKFARGQVDGRGLVRLHAKYLRRVMHPHRYHWVVQALLEGGAVERFPYAVGRWSFGYRLNCRFIADRHVRVPVSDPRLAARLCAFHRQSEVETNARLKPVHIALAKQQQRLCIDSGQAREIIDCLPTESNPFDAQGILATDLERRNFHLNVGRYGRVSNNITSMKRELRIALRIGQQPLAGVDIACAQPAFVGKLTLEESKRQINAPQGQTKPTAKSNEAINQGQQGTSNGADRQTEEHTRTSIYDSPIVSPGSGDLDDYLHLVQRGRLYEELLCELERIGVVMSRDQLKRRFLCDVLAKRKANRWGAEYPSQVEEVFRRRFPHVYGFIRRFNRDGWEHENLIRELQRQESLLVIETIAASFLARYPATFIITLHDAIYTTPRHLRKLETAFRQSLNRIGFPLTLNVKSTSMA